ncbi:MAG: sugar phosphate isomerase/epimerase family protein [Opitutaceae bacterium]
MLAPISRRTFLSHSAVGVSALLAGSSLRATDAQPSTQITMLSDMAGSDFEQAARRHAELGLKWLDLRNALWGETINNLSLANARRVADIARDHGLSVFCLSTSLCLSNLEDGEAAFRKRHLPALDHVLKIAGILQPQRIRMLSAAVKPFPTDEPVMALVERKHAWVFGAYREMIDRMVGSGQRVLIENEASNAIFSRPGDIVRFFKILERHDMVRCTWDTQNLWQMGVFPTMEVYRTLKPLIGCLHLKGGRTKGDGKALVWASALEDASWAVAEIVRAAVADGVAPFICINTSHGKRPPGFDPWMVAQRDIAFLRKTLGA